jgi:Uma2 family endonuclease
MPKTATRTKAMPASSTKVIGEWPDVRFELDVSHLITEDDTPVDNLYSEKQQRLLTEPLYSSWRPVQPGSKRKRRPFLAAANVGLFPSINEQAIVPDVFLSLDVSVPANWYAKEGRSYFFWEFGKAPEIVLEIVSNRKGGEATSKLEKYARCGIAYYAVYDPTHQLGKQVLRLYELRDLNYVQRTQRWLPALGLGLTLWQGVYEDKEETWLRWCDEQGGVIPTGAERAEHEAQRAAAVDARNQVLAAKLRELGIDPEQL